MEYVVNKQVLLNETGNLTATVVESRLDGFDLVCSPASVVPPWLVSNYDVSNWACKCTAYSISCDFTFTQICKV